MIKQTLTVTHAYRCNDYSRVGWAVEFDGKWFGVGSTWGEALCNAVYDKEPDGSGDCGEFKIVIPHKVRGVIRREAEAHGTEENFSI